MLQPRGAGREQTNSTWFLMGLTQHLPPHLPTTLLQLPYPVHLPPIPSISYSTDQVRRELRRLRPRKAAGPGRLCPRLLKLAEPLQRIYNQSLHLGKAPTLWKTSCIIPIPKKGRPSDLHIITSRVQQAPFSSAIRGMWELRTLCCTFCTVLTHSSTGKVAL